MSGEIVNKIAKRGLITLEMKSFKGDQKRALIDISQWLFQGLVLKEKLFRTNLKEHNWEEYKDKYVAIYCSTDTIIPVWAYMLVGKYLQPYAKKCILGDKFSLEKEIFDINIKEISTEEFTDKRILIDSLSFKLSNSFNSEVFIPSRFPLYQSLNCKPFKELRSKGFKNCWRNWECPFQNSPSLYASIDKTSMKIGLFFKNWIL